MQAYRFKITPRRSGSFKVTDFGTNGKPIYDFLLVNNTNVHPISDRFQAIAERWSSIIGQIFDVVWSGAYVPRFNAVVWFEPNP